MNITANATPATVANADTRRAPAAPVFASVPVALAPPAEPVRVAPAEEPPRPEPVGAGVADAPLPDAELVGTTMSV